MTREESLVAYTNGIRQFIILVNKMDKVNYSQERFQEISVNILSILTKLGLNEKVIYNIN